MGHSFVVVRRNPIKKKRAAPKRKTVAKRKAPVRKTVARKVAVGSQATRFVATATAAAKIVPISADDLHKALKGMPGVVCLGKAPVRVYKFRDGSCVRLTHKSLKVCAAP